MSDRDFGSVLRMAGTDGSLLLDGQGNFRFRLTTTLTIQKLETAGAANSASTTATLYIRKGRFTLPDFSIGTVGVQNVQAEFYRTPEGTYSIQAKASFNFEAFSVDGSFKLIYVTQPPELTLRLLKLAF